MPGEEVGLTYDSIEMVIKNISSAVPTVVQTSHAATKPVISPTNTLIPETPASIIIKNNWLKSGHGIGYFFLGLSILYALPIRSKWSPSIALILCCFYSFTDEFHQSFTLGRTASVNDMLIDTLAALIGVAIMLGVMASRIFFNQKQVSAD